MRYNYSTRDMTVRAVEYVPDEDGNFAGRPFDDTETSGYAYCGRPLVRGSWMVDIDGFVHVFDALVFPAVFSEVTS